MANENRDRELFGPVQGDSALEKALDGLGQVFYFVMGALVIYSVLVGLGDG